MQDISDIGLPVASNNRGSLLFKRLTTDNIIMHRDCQFADNSALVAVSRGGAQRAIEVFIEVVASFGLSVNLTKTKFMTVGYGITPAVRAPLSLPAGSIEHVDHFRYLASIVHADGRSTSDIKSRIASASRAFGALRRPIFSDSNLSLGTKRLVFVACVLALLLYCAECWVSLQRDLTALSTFYRRCIRSVMGITQREAWDLHLHSCCIATSSGSAI